MFGTFCFDYKLYKNKSIQRLLIPEQDNFPTHQLTKGVLLLNLSGSILLATCAAIRLWSSDIFSHFSNLKYIMVGVSQQKQSPSEERGREEEFRLTINLCSPTYL